MTSNQVNMSGIAPPKQVGTQKFILAAGALILVAIIGLVVVYFMTRPALCKLPDDAAGCPSKLFSEDGDPILEFPYCPPGSTEKDGGYICLSGRDNKMCGDPAGKCPPGQTIERCKWDNKDPAVYNGKPYWTCKDASNKTRWIPGSTDGFCNTQTTSTTSDDGSMKTTLTTQYGIVGAGHKIDQNNKTGDSHAQPVNGYAVWHLLDDENGCYLQNCQAGYQLSSTEPRWCVPNEMGTEQCTDADLTDPTKRGYQPDIDDGDGKFPSAGHEYLKWWTYDTGNHKDDYKCKRSGCKTGYYGENNDGTGACIAWKSKNDIVGCATPPRDVDPRATVLDKTTSCTINACAPIPGLDDHRAIFTPTQIGDTGGKKTCVWTGCSDSADGWIPDIKDGKPSDPSNYITKDSDGKPEIVETKCKNICDNTMSITQQMVFPVGKPRFSQDGAIPLFEAMWDPVTRKCIPTSQKQDGKTKTDKIIDHIGGCDTSSVEPQDKHFVLSNDRQTCVHPYQMQVAGANYGKYPGDQGCYKCPPQTCGPMGAIDPSTCHPAQADPNCTYTPGQIKGGAPPGQTTYDIDQSNAALQRCVVGDLELGSDTFTESQNYTFAEGEVMYQPNQYQETIDNDGVQEYKGKGWISDTTGGQMAVSEQQQPYQMDPKYDSAIDVLYPVSDIESNNMTVNNKQVSGWKLGPLPDKYVGFYGGKGKVAKGDNGLSVKDSAGNVYKGQDRAKITALRDIGGFIQVPAGGTVEAICKDKKFLSKTKHHTNKFGYDALSFKPSKNHPGRNTISGALHVDCKAGSRKAMHWESGDCTSVADPVSGDVPYWSKCQEIGEIYPGGE